MTQQEFDDLAALARYEARVLTEEQWRRVRLSAENAVLRAILANGGEPPSPRTGGFGYYQQGTDVDAIYTPQEQRWQRTFDRILCFLPDETWDDIAVPAWWAEDFGAARSRWAADYGTVVSMPLCPDGVPSIDAIDPVDIWDAFGRAGRNLVTAGLARSILRIGWESQGTWYRWSSVDHPGTYKARFRDAVDALRQAEGQEFLIDWNIAGGKPVDLDAFPDPGDVDVVSIDLYATPGNDVHDFTAWADQAAEIAEDASCRVAVAEWGLWDSDRPDYMEWMTGWIDEHDCMHQAYFDVSSSSDHRLSRYPNSEQVYATWAAS